MTELIRDTTFGHIVRLLSRNRFLQFREERDPSVWKEFVNPEKSINMAQHGQITPPDDLEKDVHAPDDSSHGSSRTTVGEHNGSADAYGLNTTNTRESRRVKIDPEKGRDIHIVDWYDENDSENPMNWSTGKKFFVTFEICLLTFSVYIGSAIYTAGEMTVEKQFHVSEVAATLGLTLFVAGYGLGPMIWCVFFRFSGSHLERH